MLLQVGRLPECATFSIFLCKLTFRPLAIARHPIITAGPTVMDNVFAMKDRRSRREILTVDGGSWCLSTGIVK